MIRINPPLPENREYRLTIHGQGCANPTHTIFLSGREKEIQTQILNDAIKVSEIPTNLISDGYHTFGELYEFRKMYNAALFNEWAKYHMEQEAWKSNGGITIVPTDAAKYQVHKSWKHHDGELAFGGGWFIVSAMLPTGQISNHYEAKDWDLFRIPETEKALFEFDGHTAADVLDRLSKL